MSKQISRIKEPSTWASFSAILGALASIPSPATPALAAVATICGAVGVYLRESSNAEQTK